MSNETNDTSYSLVQSILGALGVSRPRLKYQETLDLIAIQPLLPDLEKLTKLIEEKSYGANYSNIIFGYLIERLSDRNKGLRESSAYLLGRIGDSIVTPHLIARLQVEKQNNVKIRLIEALGMMKAKEARHLILNFLNDRNWKIRRSAIEALEEIGDPNIGNILIRILKNDKEPFVRAAVANIIGRNGSKQWNRELSEIFENERDEEVRLCIAEALNDLGDPRLLKLYLEED
ncbi:MAG: HEAT repeat domain-containing protein [Candidatus Hermodarchaeota archaeon]